MSRFTRTLGTLISSGVSILDGLEITVAPGREVRMLPEGDRYLGFLFARADTILPPPAQMS